MGPEREEDAPRLQQRHRRGGLSGDGNVGSSGGGIGNSNEDFNLLMEKFHQEDDLNAEIEKILEENRRQLQ